MIELSRFLDTCTVTGEVKDVKKVSTDTRSIELDDCFLALKGENFDGNAYLEKALEGGASGCVFQISDETNAKVKELTLSYPQKFFIGVENAELYFQELAKFHQKNWRMRGDTLTIGITGSNGKTTTKEMLAGLLEELFPGEILFTSGNLNNHLGVPMTLLRLGKSHRICILEMGTNHPGEIPFLAKLGDPDAGIITCIGQSHLEFFDNEANVFKEKRTLYDYVASKGGFFSVDGDDEFLKTIDENKALKKIGLNNNGIEFVPKKKGIKLSGEVSFEALTPFIVGDHNLKNLSLVLGLLLSIYPDKKDALQIACESLKLPSNNRSEVRVVNGKEYFLDAYNANPSSMKASIKTYVEEIGSSESLFVLGDMNELGDKSPTYHQEIGEFLKSHNIENVIFVGRFAEFYNEGFGGNGKTFDSTDSLKNEWKTINDTNDKFFLKGSRTLQLESLVALN